MPGSSVNAIGLPYFFLPRTLVYLGNRLGDVHPVPVPVPVQALSELLVADLAVLEARASLEHPGIAA